MDSPAPTTIEQVRHIMDSFYDLVARVDIACVEWGVLDYGNQSPPDEVVTDELGTAIGLYWSAHNHSVDCPMAFFFADEAGRKAMVEAEGRRYRSVQERGDNFIGDMLGGIGRNIGVDGEVMDTMLAERGWDTPSIPRRA